MNNSIRTAAKTMAAVIAAGAMAVAPVAGTINFGAMTAMAAPAKTDKGTVVIRNVESGVTVSLYKIIGREWDETAGDQGWKVVDAAKSAVNLTTTSYTANVQSLTSLATAGTLGSATTATYADTADSTKNVIAGDYYAENLAPGAYFVLVSTSSKTGTINYIYNPMIVTISYDTQSNLTTDNKVDANTNASGDIVTTAYAKRSPISIVKKITNPDGTSGNYSESKADGDDLQVGDTQTFSLTTTMPDYRGYNNDNGKTGTDKKELTFTISDNQDAGLDLVANSVTVTVNSAAATAGTDYTISYGQFTNDPAATGDRYGTLESGEGKASNDFQIVFTPTYIKAHANESITVTYSSTLNSSATQQSSANDNDVKLTYTNDYNFDTKETSDHTYDYTFPVQVKKVAAENTNTVLSAGFKIYRMQMNAASTALEEFNTTSNANHVAAPVAEVTTDAQTGLGTFERLDEGYYRIEESTPPTGYSKNTEKFYIKITPEYDTDGTLKSYSISQVDAAGQTIQEGVSSASFTQTHSTDGTYDVLQVKDTKVTGLPSTGARSALILTIAGIAVMITVMAASRRKKIAD